MESHTQPNRQLLLIRHAKAVEDDPGGDHARGLAARGVADAESLGAWLRAEGLRPDLILCSTARRTRETLAHLQLGNTPTILSDKLYLAMPGELLHQIQTMDDTVTTLAVLAHNPGLHALLGLLAGRFANPADADRMLLKFPTSACAVLRFEAPHWHSIAPETGQLSALR